MTVPLRINFKLVWTLLASLLLLAVLYHLINPFASSNQLDKLRYLGVSAGRMMDRHMQFYEGYGQVPMFERALHNFLFGPEAVVEQEAIQVYREVLQHLGNATDDAEHAAQLNIKSRLLVTIAERRSRAELAAALKLLTTDPEEDVIASAIRYAYLDADAKNFSTEIHTGANLLPLGWSADRLRYRIALKTGNDLLANILIQRLEKRGHDHRLFVRWMMLTVGAIILLGLYLVLRPRVLHTISPWHRGILDSPWPFIDGYAVAVTAALAGLIISLLLHILPDNPYFTPSFLTSWSTLFASLPMLWLMHRYLLKPRGLTWRRAFGLRRPEDGWRHFVTTTFALLALDWIGVLLIGWGTWQLGLGSHWSEGMQERLVFGPQQTVWFSAINIVVWAAIFEEIGFRGLFYTSLRHRLPPTTAIAISALLFAALHLYSVAGFLSVFWSGLILAYAYERYHSLLPGMMIHAAGNLLSLGPVLLFYR
jgi:uncharacterized protein